LPAAWFVGDADFSIVPSDGDKCETKCQNMTSMRAAARTKV
jgi:hypothetical protein